MPTLKVAHVNEQGVDLIIVPLDPSFGSKSKGEQDHAIVEIQSAARSAGLAGTVVPVWESSGRMRFIAPTRWHPFFQSLSFDRVAANVNRTLTW